MKQAFENIFNNKVDAVGLSVFRICYALIVFFETANLCRYRKIIFDSEPFSYIGEINTLHIFFIWYAILAMLIIGLFTRFCTILNYIFGIIIFSSASHFSYHVYYTYITISFLMIFLPMSRVFSLDSLLKKLQYRNVGILYKTDRNVLEINYLILIFAGIALPYFDSLFRKLDSQMWIDGLGLWLPSSLPMLVWNDFTTLLNIEWLVKFLGYLVIVFEAIFIFLFWFKRFRIPLLLVGLFFHIGILLSYPIPFFALTSIAVLLLLVPPPFWRTLLNMIQGRIAFPRISNFFKKFDGQPLPKEADKVGADTLKYVSIDDFFFDSWNRLSIAKKTWKYTIFLMLFLQLLIMSSSPFIQRGIGQTIVGTAVNKINNVLHRPLKVVFGITSHPVFVYNIHFEGYNHIFKFVSNANHKIVPLLDDNGMVTNSYATGGLWAYYSFALSARVLNQEKFEDRLPRFLRYFEKENNLANTAFTIYFKEIETTGKWEKNFLHRQMKRPWKRAGTCRLTKKDAIYTWDNTMQAIFDSEKP